MEHGQLVGALRARGILFEDQPGFRGMVTGIDEDRRIVCAESLARDGFHGISFWLYGKGSDWYLGLWSGVHFRLLTPDRLPDIAAHLLAGHTVDAGRAPADLTDAACQQLGLVRVESS
jgi:hypothetical protein